MAAAGTLWQHPFVNVFKLCGVDAMKNCVAEGDVQSLLDKTIGKKVLRIWGNISAANYFQLPKSRSSSLGLTGRFLYAQLKPAPPKYFVFHVDVMTQQRTVVRISISNLFKHYSQGKTHVVQIPWEPTSNQWCIMVVDLPEIVEEHTNLTYASIKNIQLCSCMVVRNLYTSDIKYSSQTLPRDMVLPVTRTGIPVYYFSWLPREPLDVSAGTSISMATRTVGSRRAVRPSATVIKHYSQDGATPKSLRSEEEEELVATFADNTAAAEAEAEAEMAAQVKVVRHSVPDLDIPLTVGKLPPYEGKEKMSAALKRGGDVYPVVQAAGLGMKPDRAAMAPEDTSRSPLQPDRAANLHHVIGFSGERSNTLLWAPQGREVAFAVNQLLVVMDTVSGHQRYFVGHTANIIALALSGDGSVLATAQEGKSAIIRAWNFATGACIGIMCAHAGGGLTSLDFSPDGRAVAAVGLNEQKQQQVVIWDVSRLMMGERASVVVSHLSDHNIKCLRFSQYEEDRLVTCGRDTIRFHRMKAGTLRGCSIQLGEHRAMALPPKDEMSRNIFTDMAFEVGYGVTELDKKHIFVASASGSVFQVNYGRRCLECVYQLHNGAINSIRVTEGFCVTGSDDKFVRVWPVDFSDFFLEAEHEAPVTSVAVSFDGLQLALGTENGSIGMLDIPTHKYATLMRSHTDSVNAVALDPNSPQMCSASADGSVRVWDLETCQQLVEFVAPGERCHCVTYHPHLPQVAVGFEDGLLRIFSVADTKLVQEHKQHKSRVAQILFTPDGSRMFTAGDEGNLCVYDPNQAYLPIKFLATSLASRHTAMALSPDGNLLASLGPEATVVLFYDAHTLTPHSRLDPARDPIANLAFSPDSKELIVTTVEMRIERYDLTTGQLAEAASSIHRTRCDALAVDPTKSFLLTGGFDSLVKVWEYSLSPFGSYNLPAFQSFVGHCDCVTTAQFHKALSFVVSADMGHSIFLWRFHGQPPTLTAQRSADIQAQMDSISLQEPASSEPSLLASPTRSAIPSDTTSAAPRASQSPGRSPRGGTSAATTAPSSSYGAPSVPQSEQDADEAPEPRPSAPAPPIPQSSASKHPGLSTPRYSVSVAPVSSATVKAFGEEAIPAPSPSGPGPSLHPADPPKSPRAAAMGVLTSRKTTQELVVGYTYGEKKNVVWDQKTGVFAYSTANVVVLEDMRTRRQRHLQGHTTPVSCLAINATAELLASGSAKSPSVHGISAPILIWSVPNASLIGTFTQHATGVEAMLFSADGGLLVSIGQYPEPCIMVWDVGTKAVVASTQVPEPIHSLCWRPMAIMPEFFTAGARHVSLWALDHPPAGAASLRSHTIQMPADSDERVYTSMVALDTNTMVIGDALGGCWKVSVESRAVEWMLGTTSTNALAGWVASGSLWARPGKLVAGGAGTECHLVVWVEKVGTFQEEWMATWQLELDAPVSAVVMDEEGVEGVVATQAASLWYINVHDHSAVPLLGGHNGNVLALAVAPRPAPSGSVLVGTACADGLLRVWESDSFTKLMQFEMPGQRCTCVAMGPSGAHCIAGYSDGLLCCYDLQQVAAQTTWKPHNRSVIGVLYLGGLSEWVLSADIAGQVAVSDPASGRVLAVHDNTTPWVEGMVRAEALIMRGAGPRRVLAVAWADRVDCFVLDLDAVPALAGRAVTALSTIPTGVAPATTPMGRELPPTLAVFSMHDQAAIIFYSSSSTPGSILSLHAERQEVIRSVSLDQPAFSIALSTDGKLLTVGTQDGNAWICYSPSHLDDPTSWLKCQGHQSPVRAMGYLSDCTKLITASDEVLRVWKMPWSAEEYHHMF